MAAAGYLASLMFCCVTVAPLVNDNERKDEYDNGYIAYVFTFF